MKDKALAFLLVVLLFDTAYAQKPFQLLVLGYDYQDQAVYFCGSKRLNEIATSVVAINILSQTDPQLTVDSIRSSLDLTQFSKSFEVGPIEVPQSTLMTGPVYRPVRLGSDTIKLVGYYGPYVTYGQVVCYAKELTKPLLSGISRTEIKYNGNGVVLQNHVLRDTLLDYFRLAPYETSEVPQATGKNKAIVIRSCAGTFIDSVKLNSDFSEFSFHNLPTNGQAIPDSFAITYDFTPKIVGDHIRNVSFKLNDGRWLTWIFQYRVRPKSSVATPEGGRANLRVTFNWPILTINSDKPLGDIDFINSNGVARRVANRLDERTFQINTQEFSTGCYFIRATGTASTTKVLIH